MSEKGLTIVGWYHSHPTSEPKPTESDILSQNAYQDAVKRENGDKPCIAIITSMNYCAHAVYYISLTVGMSLC